MNKKIIFLIIGIVVLSIIFFPQIEIFANSLNAPFVKIEVSTNQNQYYLGDVVYIKVKNNGNVPVGFNNSPGDGSIVSISNGKFIGSMGTFPAERTFFPGEQFEVKIKIPRDDNSLEGEIFKVSVPYNLNPNDFPNVQLVSLRPDTTTLFAIIENKGWLHNEISEKYQIEIIGLEQKYFVDEPIQFSLTNSGFGNSCGSYKIGVKGGEHDSLNNMLLMDCDVKNLNFFDSEHSGLVLTIDEGLSEQGTYTAWGEFRNFNDRITVKIEKNFTVIEN